METFTSRLSELIEEFSDGKHTKFAKKAGIPTSSFQYYIKGNIPKSEHLLRIFETFNVSIDWLLTGEGSKFIEKRELAVGLSETEKKFGVMDKQQIDELKKKIIEWEARYNELSIRYNDLLDKFTDRKRIEDVPFLAPQEEDEPS